MKLKISVDILMTVALIFLMPYELIGSYIFLKMHFVFFDYTEPLMFFVLDYIAVMGLFIAVGYYLGTFLRKHQVRVHRL